MKRPLILSGAICGTVINAISTFSTLLYAIIMSELLVSEIGEVYFLLPIIIISLLFAVTALVLNALSITTWKKNIEVFKKKKAIIITSIVFDFLTALFLLIGFTIWNLLFSLVLITAGVLKIVDLAKENKRIQESAAEMQTEIK